MSSEIDGKTSMAFRCPSDTKDERFKDTWTDEDWMEWQANGIAPRILMPRETVGAAFERFKLECCENPFIAANLIPPERWIIEQLAAFFQVSKQSAEIRLKELGYLLI
jgi:Zn-dependent peptidase ImmA (M78 family)